MNPVVRVALDLAFSPYFDYYPGDLALEPGQWVWVPWGRSERLGVVLATQCTSALPPERIRKVGACVQDAPRIDAVMLRFFERAAHYYHATPGELLLASIPRALRKRTPRKPDPVGAAWQRWQARLAALHHQEQGNAGADATHRMPGGHALHPEQRAALEQLTAHAGRFAPMVLHGVTGSGKTAVYLAFVAWLLEREARAQVLLLVPEIGLTPQLAALIRSALPLASAAVMHSGLRDSERAAIWLAAARGELQLLVGTRSAISMLLPGLCAIVVDEEHDPSYKQLEGVHYHARDLAVLRAKLLAIPVVLASATPSMETWRAVLAGRYTIVRLRERANRQPPPAVEIIDMRGLSGTQAGLAPQSLAAIDRALAAGGQALVFLNRRGFAPVLHCGSCGWSSPCSACSTYRVLHRRQSGFVLLCHHCGLRAEVPRHCPQCGNTDLSPQGRGTQKLAEELGQCLPGARIARIDRDSSASGRLPDLLAQIHRGEVDLVVGTQMLAKGHDWERLRTVVVLEADSGLFAADFRASERLFANLMQVAGRAGRAASSAGTEAKLSSNQDGDKGSAIPPTVLVQSLHPRHPLFADLRRQDFEAHAGTLLAERANIGLPPFRYHALLRAQARTHTAVDQFMAQAKRFLEEWITTQPTRDLRCYDPVPMLIARVDHWHRLQLLLDAAQRPLLHRALEAFGCVVRKPQAWVSGVRWQIDVDPQEI